MRLSGIELQKATGGDWQKGSPESISGISTDTRKFIEGQAFLALRGPNFDGHRFADRVASNAHALIGDKQGTKLWSDLELPQLQVEDTLTALGDIANAWRNRLSQTTVIAITGSYGKTTVRSMLSHVFKTVGVETSATHANLNNLVGVPTTLLGINESTEVALIECGISEQGEMARLSEIVQPDIAVITGISAAHSTGLGGVEGVAREKSYLVSHLLPQGWCVFGSGVSRQLKNESIPHISIDMDSKESDAVQWVLEGQSLKLSTSHEEAELTLSLPARHWAANMALTATVVLKYFRQSADKAQPELQKIADILSGWQAVDGRMATVPGINGITILDDSYNANPISMQAALDTLAQLPGHKTAIIGDMAELEDSARAHADLDISNIDSVILVGNKMQVLKKTQPKALWFATTDEALQWTSDHSGQFGKNDYLLIKGSRSMQLDRIVRAMTNREGIYAL
ncbi:MAG: UDP-N-acetylmuramoyl-tripeptide--D-alanyl-D-alanine ligase [Mariprofundaceae bacterium]